MGEATEPGDDIVVMMGKLDGFRNPEFLLEPNRALLVPQVFGMHEREVEKSTKLRLDLIDRSLARWRDRPPGEPPDRSCTWLGRPGTCFWGTGRAEYDCEGAVGA